MTNDLDDIRDRLQRELRAAVPESTYEIWLAPLVPVDLEDGQLALEAPAGIRSLVSRRFGRLLDAAAAAVLGAGTTVVVDAAAPDTGGPGSARGAGRTPRTSAREATTSRRAPSRWNAEAPTDAVRRGSPLSAGPPPTPLNPKLTFDQFVIGDANRFAHAAALAVAEMPGQAYNPLFLYGPPGVGKTHLLHAIGNYVTRYGDGLTVRYATAEHFTNAFLAAIHGGDVEAFKDGFRQIDVLLIDDVQFLESKAKTEEEFFHTFNALYDTGAQVVLTSDRTPRDLDALHDRLRERFESGLVSDVASPDRATRIGVLRKRVDHDRVVLAENGALDVIADRVTTNVRALEGALIRVVAFASLERRPITAELAGRVLDTLYPRERRAAAVDVRQIQDLVCEAFSLTREELLGPGRTARVSWPRQVAMYLAREHTAQTLPAIAAAFGGKNHTTVLYAVRKTAERLGSDPEAGETVAELTRRLTSPEADRDD